jgi:hypothetical protein
MLMMRTPITRRARVALFGLAAASCAGLFLGLPSSAPAQDIPGIENCSAEKDMARRTGCLQSNVNYLKAQLTQMQTVTFGRIEAANRQIDALKTAVISLQATVTELKAAKQPASAQKPEMQKSEPTAEPAKK